MHVRNGNILIRVLICTNLSILILNCRIYIFIFNHSSCIKTSTSNVMSNILESLRLRQVLTKPCEECDLGAG